MSAIIPLNLGKEKRISVSAELTQNARSNFSKSLRQRKASNPPFACSRKEPTTDENRFVQPSYRGATPTYPAPLTHAGKVHTQVASDCSHPGVGMGGLASRLIVPRRSRRQGLRAGLRPVLASALRAALTAALRRAVFDSGNPAPGH